jgi:hypothetical protein
MSSSADIKSFANFLVNVDLVLNPYGECRKPRDATESCYLPSDLGKLG